jgi:hypothetical protein
MLLFCIDFFLFNKKKVGGLFCIPGDVVVPGTRTLKDMEGHKNKQKQFFIVFICALYDNQNRRKMRGNNM